MAPTLSLTLSRAAPRLSLHASRPHVPVRLAPQPTQHWRQRNNEARRRVFAKAAAVEVGDRPQVRRAPQAVVRCRVQDSPEDSPDPGATSTAGSCPAAGTHPGWSGAAVLPHPRHGASGAGAAGSCRLQGAYPPAAGLCQAPATVSGGGPPRCKQGHGLHSSGDRALWASRLWVHAWVASARSSGAVVGAVSVTGAGHEASCGKLALAATFLALCRACLSSVHLGARSCGIWHKVSAHWVSWAAYTVSQLAIVGL